MTKCEEIFGNIKSVDTWVLASIFDMMMTHKYGSRCNYMNEIKNYFDEYNKPQERQVRDKFLNNVRKKGIDQINPFTDFDITDLCCLMLYNGAGEVRREYLNENETGFNTVLRVIRSARNFNGHAPTEIEDRKAWWHIWRNASCLEILYSNLAEQTEKARTIPIIKCFKGEYSNFLKNYEEKINEIYKMLPQCDTLKTVEIDVRDQYQQYLDGIIVTISKNGNAIAKFTTLKSAAILQLETGTYSIEFNSAEYAIPGNQTFEVQGNKKKYSFQANRKEATVTWMIVDDENNNPVKGMKVKVVGSGFNHDFCTRESAEQFKMPFGKYNVYSVEPSPDGYVLKNDCVEIREDKSIQMIAQREEDREAKEEEEKRAREAAERKRREEEEAREAEERKRKEEEKKAREAAERKRREEEKAREAEERKRKEEEKKAKEAEEKKRKEEADQTFCKAFAGILNEADRKEHLPEYLQSLRTMAEWGHEPSGLLLGFMYLNGLYVERDEKAGWGLIGPCALSAKEYSGRAEKLLEEGNRLLSVIYMLGDAMIYENEERYIGVGIQFWIRMKNYEFCLACLKKGEKKLNAEQRRMFEKLCGSDGRKYFEKVANSMQKDGR